MGRGNILLIKKSRRWRGKCVVQETPWYSSEGVWSFWEHSFLSKDIIHPFHVSTHWGWTILSLSWTWGIASIATWEQEQPGTQRPESCRRKWNHAAHIYLTLPRQQSTAQGEEHLTSQQVQMVGSSWELN